MGLAPGPCDDQVWLYVFADPERLIKEWSVPPPHLRLGCGG